MAATRAKRLKALLEADQRTAIQAQRSFLATEDALNALEDRESRRNARDQTVREDVQNRMPAAGGGQR